MMSLLGTHHVRTNQIYEKQVANNKFKRSKTTGIHKTE